MYNAGYLIRVLSKEPMGGVQVFSKAEMTLSGDVGTHSALSPKWGWWFSLRIKKAQPQLGPQKWLVKIPSAQRCELRGEKVVRSLVLSTLGRYSLPRSATGNQGHRKGSTASQMLCVSASKLLYPWKTNRDTTKGSCVWGLLPPIPVSYAMLRCLTTITYCKY